MLKRIDQVLSSVAPKVSSKNTLLREMTMSARSRLPENIASHSWIGGFDEHSLTIITDSPGYVIYLRAHQREILKQVSEDYAHRLRYRWRKVRVLVARQSRENPVPDQDQGQEQEQD